MWESWITAWSPAKFGVKLFHVAWPEMGVPRVAQAQSCGWLWILI